MEEPRFRESECLYTEAEVDELIKRMTTEFDRHIDEVRALYEAAIARLLCPLGGLQ